MGDSGVGIYVTMESPRGLVRSPEKPHYSPYILVHDNEWPQGADVVDLCEPTMRADDALCVAIGAFVQRMLDRHLDQEADAAAAEELSRDVANYGWGG